MLSILQIIGSSWIFLGIFFQLLALIGSFIPEKIKGRKDCPPISIIIAVWNEGPRIKDCISSLMNQNYPKKNEIIVVGGGTDNTEKICRKLSTKNKVKYIPEKKRKGKWFALNEGIKRAKNDIIAFIDGDCIAEKNWLKNLVYRINDVDLVIGYQIPKTEKTFISKIYRIFFLLEHFFPKDLSKFFKINIFFGFGSAAKKKIFKEVKFKKSLVEDWRFCFDVRRKKFKIGFTPNAIVYHSPPKTLNDLRNEVLRCLYGINSELIKKKDFLSIIVLVLTLLFIINIPFYIYNVIFCDFFTLLTTSIGLLTLIIYILVCSLKQGKPQVIFYLPHLLFFSGFCFLMNIESISRVIFKKEFGWPTINKL